MGQTRFYPVFESEDLDAAYAAAKRLLALSDTDEVLTTLWAEAPDKSELDKLSGTLARPDAPATISRQGDGGSRPGWWTFETWSRSERSFEVPFLQAARHLVASVGWEVAWPEVPELDLCHRHDHSEVQLMLNCAGIYMGQPAAGHLVYVHVKWSDTEDDQRAEWLATQAGLQVPGAGEIGW